MLCPPASSATADTGVINNSSRGSVGKHRRRALIRKICVNAAPAPAGDREHRALACFARHGHVAAHHPREPARERKAEPGTPERRAVSESAWGPLCITANLLADWPLRVISRQSIITEPCPLYPQKRTNGRHRRMSALCQKRT